MKKKRRRRAEINVPVASMGDIAFLLIIFFMVCSRFAQEAGKNIQLPSAAEVMKLKETAVSVIIDAEGVIYFQGQRVPDSNAVEWGVRAQLEGKTGEDAKTVLFRCDRSVGKNVFEPVLEAIAKGGGRIAAMGDEKKIDASSR